MIRHLKFLWTVLLSIVLLSACDQNKEPDSINTAGDEVYFSPPNPSNNNGVILLNVWADWCEPCRAEMKILNQVSQEGNVAIYGWHIDNPTLDLLQQYRTFYGISYPLLQPKAIQKMIALPEVQIVPTTFALKDGKVVAKHFGPQQLSDLQALIAEANGVQTEQ